MNPEPQRPREKKYQTRILESPEKVPDSEPSNPFAPVSREGMLPQSGRHEILPLTESMIKNDQRKAPQKYSLQNRHYIDPAGPSHKNQHPCHDQNDIGQQLKPCPGKKRSDETKGYPSPHIPFHGKGEEAKAGQ